MSGRKKRALGRGMSDIVDGSFSSIVHQPQTARPPAAAAPPPPPAPAPVETLLARTAPVLPGVSDPVVEPGAAPRGYEVVAVSSGKGGTGKSVLASNLGAILAATSRVTVLDADLGLANLHILYNLMPRYNVSHVISGQKRLDDILIEGPGGVGLIPGGSGIPEMAGLSAARFGALVDAIGALSRATDLLIIDTPSGIDRQSLLFLLASDQVLVVTTDDITSMTDAYAVIKTIFARRPEASASLVVNRARTEAEGLQTYHRVAHVTRKFLSRELALGGIVPLDEAVERSVAERVPVALSHPDSPAARAMASIAARLAPLDACPAARAVRPFAARLRDLVSAVAN